MDDVLYLKFRQHGDLRTLLLNTYPADLVYDESREPYWGDGAGNGRNELGKSLMRVRDRLRIEAWPELAETERGPHSVPLPLPPFPRLTPAPRLIPLNQQSL